MTSIEVITKRTKHFPPQVLRKKGGNAISWKFLSWEKKIFRKKLIFLATVFEIFFETKLGKAGFFDFLRKIVWSSIEQFQNWFWTWSGIDLFWRSWQIIRFQLSLDCSGPIRFRIGPGKKNLQLIQQPHSARLLMNQVFQKPYEGYYNWIISFSMHQCMQYS